MRWLIFMLVFSFHGLDLQSQSCSKYITKNIQNQGYQSVTTKSIRLVFRSNYFYSIQYILDQNGMRARFISENGVELNQDDELILVNKNGVRKVFVFYGPGQLKKKRNVGIEFTNHIKLGIDDIKWISSHSIQTIYVKNNYNLQMRKFTLSSATSGDFLMMSKCFAALVDPEAINSKSESKPTAIVPPESPSSNAKISEDEELKQLESDLAQAKASVRKSIEREYEKLEAVKEQIANEIITAKQKAEDRKAEIAREVLNARKKADEELAVIQKRNQEAIKEDMKNVEEQKYKLAEDVRQKKAESEEKIRLIEIETQQKIVAIKDSAQVEINNILQELKNRRTEYADEIASSREAAELQLNEIRENTKEKIQQLRKEAQKSEEQTLEDLKETRKSIGEQILAAKEESVLEIAKIKENNVLEKERLAVELTEAKRRAAEEVALAKENAAAELSDLQSDNQERLKVQKLEYENQLRSIQDSIQMLNREFESYKEGLVLKKQALKEKSSQEIVASQEFVEEKKREKANELSLFVKKMDVQLDSIQLENQRKILEIQNNFKDRSRALTEKYDERETLLNSSMDSIGQVHHAKMIALRKRNDSLQTVYENDLKIIQENYEEKRKEIEEKALKDIAESKIRAKESQELYLKQIQDSEERAKKEMLSNQKQLEVALVELQNKKYELLEDKEQQIKDADERAQQQLREIEEKKLTLLSEQKEEINQLENQHVGQIAKLKKALRDSTENIQANLKAVISQNAEETQRIISEHKEAIAKMQSLQLSEMTELNENFELTLKNKKEEQSEVLSRLDERMKRQEKNMLTEIQSLEREHADRVLKMKTNIKLKVDQLDNQLDSLNKVGRRTIADIKNKYELDQNKLLDSLSAVLKSNRDAYAIKRQEMNERFEEERLILQNELSEARKENTERIIGARQLAEEQITAIKKETAHIEQLEREKIDKLKEEKRELEKQIKELKASKSQIQE